MFSSPYMVVLFCREVGVVALRTHGFHWIPGVCRVVRSWCLGLFVVVLGGGRIQGVETESSSPVIWLAPGCASVLLEEDGKGRDTRAMILGESSGVGSVSSPSQPSSLSTSPPFSPLVRASTALLEDPRLSYLGLVLPYIASSSSQKEGRGIHQIGGGLPQGGHLEAGVGRLQDMEILMRASGMREDGVRRVLEIIDQITARNRGKKTVIGHTLSQLEASRVDPGQLLLCVLFGECSLIRSGGKHIAAGDYADGFDFKIVSSQGPKKEGEGRAQGWLAIGTSDASGGEDHDSGSSGSGSGDGGEKIGEGTEAGGSQPRVLVMNGGPGVRVDEWIMSFIHEGTHFADFGLVLDWIRANLQWEVENRKRKRGGPGVDSISGYDKLFSTYVKVTRKKVRDRNGEGGLPRGIGDFKVELYDGFLRVFLEARAYRATVSIFEGLVSLAELQQREMLYRRVAMEDILNHGPVTEALVRRYQLNPKNVFETGERMGEIMQGTIEEALRVQGRRR